MTTSHHLKWSIRRFSHHLCSVPRGTLGLNQNRDLHSTLYLTTFSKKDQPCSSFLLPLFFTKSPQAYRHFSSPELFRRATLALARDKGHGRFISICAFWSQVWLDWTTSGPMAIFFLNENFWQFFWKKCQKKKSFGQFFDIQLAIFRRVRPVVT